MKSKHWVSVFFVLFFTGMILYMAINYHIDPLGYFAVEKGDIYYNWDDYTRAIKSKYVTDHRNQIDAVILGGSKSGVLSTERLNKYTGKKYYNFCFAYGNFSDYLIYTRYLIENTDISEIILHLSSFEVDYYTARPSNTSKVPAIVSGTRSDRITEYCSYLLTDISTLLQNRNRLQDISKLNSIVTGERNLASSYAVFDSDPEKYIRRRVLRKNFDNYLQRLFDQEANNQPAFDDNLNALRQIMTLCDENNITLKVVIGASFIGERYKYECDRYYDYLHELVTITDVWDFSDFNDINLNPYNFSDYEHYNNRVADLMIDTIYGQDSREGFGIYLTKDNIRDYLNTRKEKFRQLKQEFESAGTVDLQGMDDDSYFPVI